ncbi:transcription regulator [Coprinopsis marcescibilis]|uniref:Transcription regulator n=1 Tax=Coprinopsis marcescibilis TaxID=230819 RepID=A0A5C3KX72_COPMA|nr:transcription regulator [Coprinopsis marcescibilis]
MGLFNRKKSEASDDNASGENKKEKAGWRRPANTAFKQQRLKAWQPILTPKTVLPTLFAIGLLFAPIGGLLIWASSMVNEMTFDYTRCEELEVSTSLEDLKFFPIPSNQYHYRLSAENEKLPSPPPPSYAFLDNGPDFGDLSLRRQCIVEFGVPANLEPSLFFYYKLTNFYQNHRRYVKSFNTDQLKGKGVSASDLNNSDCRPLATRDGKPIWPCGLIANSWFNDTFSSPVLLNPPSGTNVTYQMTSKGIVWPGEAKKYASSPIGRPDSYARLSDVVPPPNWKLRYPNDYTEDNPPPNLNTDEHFQNWMRTAGLPTFTKLYARNDQDVMVSGTYRIVIGLNFPVLPYKGTKSFVISTVSAIGGKNPFLGWAYVAGAGVFVFLAVLGLARHLIKPRRLGDMSLLSWNR